MPHITHCISWIPGMYRDQNALLLAKKNNYIIEGYLKENDNITNFLNHELKLSIHKFSGSEGFDIANPQFIEVYQAYMTKERKEIVEQICHGVLTFHLAYNRTYPKESSVLPLNKKHIINTTVQNIEFLLDEFPEFTIAIENSPLPKIQTYNGNHPLMIDIAGYEIQQEILDRINNQRAGSLLDICHSLQANSAIGQFLGYNESRSIRYAIKKTSERIEIMGPYIKHAHINIPIKKDNFGIFDAHLTNTDGNFVEELTELAKFTFQQTPNLISVNYEIEPIYVGNKSYTPLEHINRVIPFGDYIQENCM